MARVPRAAVCSYNLVRTAAQPSNTSVHACGNAQVLNADLKGAMGFRGFVQSDWDATHSTSAADRGLDMEMPMATDAGAPPYYFDEARLSQLPTKVGTDHASSRAVAQAHPWLIAC